MAFPRQFGNAGTSLGIPDGSSRLITRFKPIHDDGSGTAYVYQLAINTTNNDWEMWRAAASGIDTGSFTEVDAGGAIGFTSPGNIYGAASCYDGQYIHVVWVDGTENSSLNLRYTRFNTHDNTWDSTADSVDSESTDPVDVAETVPKIAVDICTDDTNLIIAYCIRHDGGMHSPATLVEYAYATIAARSWTAGNALGGTANTGMLPTVDCNQNGYAVFAFSLDASTNLIQSTEILIGTWGTGTEAQESTDLDGNSPSALVMEYAHENGSGVDVTYLLKVDDANTYLDSIRIEDESWDATEENVVSEVVYNDTDSRYMMAGASPYRTADGGAAQSIDETFYAVWAGPDSSPALKYATKAADGSWSSATTIESGVTIRSGSLAANVFVRDGNYRLAVVYDASATNGQQIEYTEVDLGSASSDVTVSVPLGSASYAGLVPVIGLSIAVGAAAATYTGFTPTVDLTVDVPAATATYAGFAPDVQLGPWSQTVPAATATYTGFVPTVDASADTTVDVPAGAASYSGLVPAVNLSIAVPAGSATYTGLSPGVELGPWSQTVPAGSATYAGFAPDVDISITVNIPIGSATYAGAAPSVEFGPWSQTVPAGAATYAGLVPDVEFGPWSATIPVGAATYAGLVPSVTVSAHVTVDIPLGTATYAGSAPAVEFGPWTQIIPAGAATYAGFAPTLGLTLNIPVGTATYAGLAPDVEFGPWSQTVPAGSATYTGFVPDVNVTADGSVLVPTGTATYAGLEPTVEFGPWSATVPAASGTYAGLVPAVELGPWSATIPAATGTYAGFAPTVSISADVTVEVPTGTATYGGLAPSIEFGPWSQTIPLGSATYAGLIPTVTVSAHVSVAVPAGAATYTGLEPTVNDGSGSSPDLISPLGLTTPDGSRGISAANAHRTGSISRE